jgi:hypothetical protein
MRGMRMLIGLWIVVTPALAMADKTFNEGNGATVDCKQDPNVTINTNAGKYTFTGACKHVTVNGNKNALTIDTLDALNVNGNENKATGKTVKQLTVNGSKNAVDLVSVDEIVVNGKDNVFNYKKGVTGAGPKIDGKGGNTFNQAK